MRTRRRRARREAYLGRTRRAQLAWCTECVDYMCVCVAYVYGVCISMCMYIYIYTERERDIHAHMYRERYIHICMYVGR